MLIQARDYDNVKDPSLLRFLVDMRGADTEDKQLRDDLMTLLIAGHETTAAALTWGFYSLAQAPEALKQLREEVDKVVGDRRPTWDDIKQMPFLRNVRPPRRTPPCCSSQRYLMCTVIVRGLCSAIASTRVPAPEWPSYVDDARCHSRLFAVCPNVSKM